MEDVRTEKATEEKKGLLQKLAGFLGISAVEKGKVREAYEESQKDAGFRAAFETLDRALKLYDPMTDKFVYEQDEEAVKAALEDFRSIITGLLAGEDPQPEAVDEKEVDEVRAEEVKEIVKEAVAKAMAAEKETAKAEEKPERQEAPSMEEAVAKAVKEAMEAQVEAMKAAVEEQVAKAMEPVLKANHLPSNLNHETVTKEAAGEHYLHGIL